MSEMSAFWFQDPSPQCFWSSFNDLWIITLKKFHVLWLNYRHKIAIVRVRYGVSAVVFVIPLVYHNFCGFCDFCRWKKFPSKKDKNMTEWKICWIKKCLKIGLAHHWTSVVGLWWPCRHARVLSVWFLWQEHSCQWLWKNSLLQRPWQKVNCVSLYYIGLFCSLSTR